MQNLLLLHGALGTSRDLTAIGEALEQRGIRIHHFLFPGHGEKEAPGAFHIEQFTLALEQYIVQNNLTGTDVFGYSMGGYVALALAARQTEIFRRIITLGTKFNWSTASVEKETKQLNPEIIVQKVPAFARQLALKHGANWPDLLHKTADLMRDISSRQYLDDLTLKKIAQPVLIGLADKDQMVSLDETVHVVNTLPKAFMYMLPCTKHPVETVNAGLLGQIILDFVTDEKMK
ncbi:MAG TPA: alpha/beta fold hydrolase [Bacteroidia bacterium]|nr:alpha/beta fold hydrolase [Bacteroidia bacterium]